MQVIDIETTLQSVLGFSGTKNDFKKFMQLIQIIEQQDELIKDLQAQLERLA